jgi:hypothetical protein
MVLFIIVSLLVVLSLVAASRAARAARPPHPLVDTWARGMEFVGLWAVCLILDTLGGIFLILLVRALTPVFVSMYVLDDISIVLISAIQAFVIYVRLSSRRRAAPAR